MLATALAPLLLLAAPGAPVAAEVIEVIAGDIIESDGGRVRLIGIESPTSGTCEADAARQRLEELIGGRTVMLVPGAQGDVDLDGHQLRYVQISVPEEEDIDGFADGTLDLGAALVAEGYAAAVHDSRDGYGVHERETAYVALDETSELFGCDTAQLTLFQAPPPPPPAPVPAVAPVAALSDSGCDPNYSGCVPVDSDVDCAGGSGNGPSYTGRVQVIGVDVYDLDRDGDGVGCDS